MNQERCLGEENMKHKLSNLVINPSNFMLTHREVFFVGKMPATTKLFAL